MNPANFQICKPVSNDHRRGMRWFASLTQYAKQGMNLKHAIEFYSLYAMTGDTQYRDRSNDFLQDHIDEERGKEERVRPQFQ